jgi:hypothetical protein
LAVEARSGHAEVLEEAEHQGLVEPKIQWGSLDLNRVVEEEAAAEASKN